MTNTTIAYPTTRLDRQPSPLTELERLIDAHPAVTTAASALRTARQIEDRDRDHWFHVWNTPAVDDACRSHVAAIEARKAAEADLKAARLAAFRQYRRPQE